MPTESPQVQPKQVQCGHTPKKLRKVLLVGASLFAAVAVGGLVVRFAHANDTKAWTQKQAVPVVQLITCMRQGAGMSPCPAKCRPTIRPRSTRKSPAM